MKRLLLYLFFLASAPHLLASDNLWVKRVYPYGESENSVPACYTLAANEMYIDGFDTDGKGHFYFTGGRLPRVACFYENSLVYQHKIDFSDARLRWMKDSLYLISLNPNILMGMRADGKGEKRYVQLNPEDVVYEQYGDSSFLLGCKTKEATDAKIRILTYSYHGNVLNRSDTMSPDIFRFDYLPPNVPEYAAFKDGEGSYQYVGCFRGYRFYTHLYDTDFYDSVQDLIRVDANGKIRNRVRIDTANSWDMVNGRTSFKLIRNGKFFIVKFDSYSLEIVVLELDLDKAFEYKIAR